MELLIRKLDDNATIPSYAREGDAALDLHATKEILLNPGVQTLCGTGIAVALPKGTVGLFWGRSGLALRQGVAVLGGVIDENYRGELGVILVNHTTVPYTIAKGDRIAQMIIQPVIRVQTSVVDTLDDTGRGAGGFGSSGK